MRVITWIKPTNDRDSKPEKLSLQISEFLGVFIEASQTLFVFNIFFHRPTKKFKNHWLCWESTDVVLETLTSRYGTKLRPTKTTQIFRHTNTHLKIIIRKSSRCLLLLLERSLLLLLERSLLLLLGRSLLLLQRRLIHGRNGATAVAVLSRAWEREARAARLCTPTAERSGWGWWGRGAH